MRELSKLEQSIIIKELDLLKPLSNGSSRIVYDYGDYVVKIAIGNGGLRQNIVEYETFKKLGNEFLAEIIAFSDEMIIMEKVEELEYHEVSEIFNYEDYEEYKEYIDIYEKNVFYDIKELIHFLNETFGSTSDNFQVGYNKEDKLVSFDYGYQPIVDILDSVIGDVDENFLNRKKYIEKMFAIG